MKNQFLTIKNTSTQSIRVKREVGKSFFTLVPEEEMEVKSAFFFMTSLFVTGKADITFIINNPHGITITAA